MIASSLIFMLALCAGFPAQADETAGFQTLLADKLKEAKPIWILNPESKPAAAVFLPFWTLHGGTTDYIEAGAGARFKKDEKPYPFLGFDINLVGLSGRFWDFDWARSHVKRSVFPTIFFGPAVYLPLEVRDLGAWTWKENAGVSISVRR